jgi:putative nucleotide binding protein
MQVPSFQFFEVALNRGEVLTIQDRIEITGEKGPLGRIIRHMKYEELTPTSKDILEDVLMQYVTDNEADFVKFLNNAGPITIKRHTLEVLPGIGKKSMWDIVNERQKSPFTDFANFKTRVPGIKIEEVIAKRIIEELGNPDEKHYLFVKRHKPATPGTGGPASPRPQHQY